jgi:hypothetical protein
VGLKFNGTHQLPVYAYDVNVSGDKINIIKKITDTVADAKKEVGLEVNTVKTKCMLMHHYQNAGQIDKIQIFNTSFENLARLDIWESQ